MSGKVRDSMKTGLIEKYGVEMDNSENRIITEVWDLAVNQFLFYLFLYKNKNYTKRRM
jgi:hypothetical protein